MISNTNTVEMQERRVKIDDIPACLMARIILHRYDPTLYIKGTVTPTEFGQGADSWSDNYADLEDVEDDTIKRIPKLRSMVKMFELSDRFLITSLTEYAKTSFLSHWRMIVQDFTDPIDMHSICGVISLVYSCSPPHDSSLIDVVVDSMHKALFDSPRHRDSIGELRSLRELLAQELRLGRDILSHVYSKKNHICCICINHRRKPLILKPCNCDRPDSECQQEECVAKRIAENWCDDCDRWGTMSADPSLW